MKYIKNWGQNVFPGASETYVNIVIIHEYYKSHKKSHQNIILKIIHEKMRSILKHAYIQKFLIGSTLTSILTLLHKNISFNWYF